jgi:sigma-E factor negative regulatory protein RseB
VVDVWHPPGGRALTRLAGPPATPTTLQNLNLGEAAVLALSPQLVRLLGANYVVTVTGRSWVAGRAARTITVRHRNGRLAARFWLDAATNLPVRREVFDSHARAVSDVTFAALTIGRSALATMPAASGSRPWPDTLAPAQLAALRAGGWPLPGPLPGNFTLLSARETTTTSGPVVDLDYSDGLSVISIFFQRGYLPARLTGWSAAQLAGHRVFADDPDGLSYTWSASGFVYTVVTAAPRDAVGPAVAPLPHDDSPGLLGRMKRGLRLLLAMVSP